MLGRATDAVQGIAPARRSQCAWSCPRQAPPPDRCRRGALDCLTTKSDDTAQPVVRQQYSFVYDSHWNNAGACAPVEVITSHGSAKWHGQVRMRVDAPGHDEQARCVYHSCARRRLHSAKPTVMRTISHRHRKRRSQNFGEWAEIVGWSQGLTCSDGATAVMSPPSMTTSALNARSALTTVPSCQHCALN